MTIEIDPSGIEFIEPDRHGCCLVAYRGVVIDGLYRTPETGEVLPIPWTGSGAF